MLSSFINMKSFVVVVLFALTVVNAQRPGYVGGGPIGYPELAPRFRDNSTTTAPDLGNRLGESGTTIKIPIDARGDVDLVKRVNSWPQPNRPFWVLNAEHIERHRNPQGQRVGGQGSTAPVTNNQASPNLNNNNNLNTQRQPDVQQRFGQDNGSGNTIISERPSKPLVHGFIPGSLP